MTRGAPDAFLNVNAVVEIDEIGQVVDLHPGDRLAGAPAFAHGLEQLGVGPNSRVAGHARFGGGEAGKVGVFNRCVAVTAVDPKAADVVIVTEGDRLVAREA